MIMITFTWSLTLFNIHYKASTFLLFTQNIQIKWCPIFILIFLLRVKSGVGAVDFGNIRMETFNWAIQHLNWKIAQGLLNGHHWKGQFYSLFQQNMKIKLWKKDICSLTLPRMVKNYLKHFPLTFNFDFFLEKSKNFKSKKVALKNVSIQTSLKPRTVNPVLFMSLFGHALFNYNSPKRSREVWWFFELMGITLEH